MTLSDCVVDVVLRLYELLYVMGKQENESAGKNYGIATG